MKMGSCKQEQLELQNVLSSNLSMIFPHKLNGRQFCLHIWTQTSYSNFLVQEECKESNVDWESIFLCFVFSVIVIQASAKLAITICQKF